MDPARITSDANIFSARPFDDAARARAARLREEVERLGIVKTWLARAIGKSVNQTMTVLHGQRSGAPTLDLIETVLDAIRAGQIRPETHSAHVAPILAENGNA